MAGTTGFELAPTARQAGVLASEAEVDKSRGRCVLEPRHLP